MKTLPSAVRIAAVAGLALILAGAALVFIEGTVRFYAAGPADLTGYATGAGMWGVCLLAGFAFAWRDRLEFPEASEQRSSRTSGVIAIGAALFLAALGIAIIFYGGVLIVQPGETFSVWHFSALPAGLLLASALSLARWLEGLRTR